MYGAESLFEAVGNSYAFNAVGHPYYFDSHPNASALDPLPGGLRGHNLSQIQRPSRTVLIMDSGLIRPLETHRSWHGDDVVNMAFCDGHIAPETLPRENPYDGGDNEGIYWDATDY